MSDLPETPPEDSGPLVRPYVLTSGRQHPTGAQLDMISIVVALRSGDGDMSLEPEQRSILRLCDRPMSVAEVSAHLDIPVAVVKVLIGDLIDRGHVLARAPHTRESPVSRNILEAVLDGIQQL